MAEIARFVFEDVQTGNKFELVDAGERGQYWRYQRWLGSETTKSVNREKFDKFLDALRRDKYFEEV